VRHVDFEEHLGRRYVCSIVAACDRAPSPRELLEQEVHLHIERGAAQRTIHGIVRQADVFKEAEGASVTLEVVPALWLLSQNVRSRVFTDKSVPEVVKTIYEERLGGSQRTIRDELTRSYPTHEILVQYRESDLNFIQRRLEEEGIFFYFAHDGSTSS
jgi:type VI secretion system secreted protein VgrG